MRILVDRFIYQGLRHVPSRHAVPDQDIPPEVLIRMKTLSVRTFSGVFGHIDAGAFSAALYGY
jgi:hypothetical protein